MDEDARDASGHPSVVLGLDVGLEQIVDERVRSPTHGPFVRLEERRDQLDDAVLDQRLTPFEGCEKKA